MATANSYQYSKTQRFRRRLNIAFAQLLVVLALLIYLFYQNNQSFINASEWSDHTDKVLYTAEQVISQVKDVETGTRGFLLSGDERFLTPFISGRSNLPVTLSALSFLTRDDADQQQRIKAVSRLISKRIQLSEMQSGIRRRSGFVTTEVIALSRLGAIIMDSVRAGIAAIQGIEKKLLVTRERATRAAITRTKQSVYFFGIFMALTIIGGWILITHHFSARVKAEEEVLTLNVSLEQRIQERSEELSRVEQLLTHTLDNMIEGVQLIGFDWRYSYINDAAVTYTRFSREELIGKTIMERYPGLEHTEVFAVLKQCMEERIPISLETEFHFPDGGSDWFDISAQPVPDGILIFSTETTPRHKAQSLLNEQTALAESLLLAAPDAILGIDQNGLIKRTNHEADRMFGFRKRELLGMHIGELFGDDAAAISNAAELMKAGSAGVVRKEISARRKSGELFPIDISLSLFRSGSSATVIGSFRDITEKKMVEAQLQNLTDHLEATVQLRTEQLEAINKELDSFSYSVSHDLRAPLRAIDGYTKMLLEDHGHCVDQVGRDTMDSIRRNARRMGQLIDDLLSFSRVGKQLVVSAGVDMNRLVSGILTELPDSARAEISIHALPPANGDYSLLKQVLTNLLSNALKYSAKKERPAIEIGSFDQGEFVVFYVKDNGAGFDMNYYDKLFGVFQRLHSTRDFEGTGVGLALVRRIVLRHGGQVWAEAKEDEGATFYFSLPK